MLALRLNSRLHTVIVTKFFNLPLTGFGSWITGVGTGGMVKVGWNSSSVFPRRVYMVSGINGVAALVEEMISEHARP